MMFNESQVNSFREIAEGLTETLVSNDFGEPGLSTLKALTNGIRMIYKNLNLKRHSKVIIIKSLTSAPYIPTLGVNFQTIMNLSSLTAISENEILIEVKDNLELIVIKENIPDINTIRANAIIYLYDNEVEYFYGKTEIKKLPALNGIESYFAISTFKSLDEALEHYKVNYAQHSSCPTLVQAWLDNNTRIFFKPKPEFLLRDSLYYFLKARLRENVEVARESTMDDTHPVDIKVTWNYTQHIAIIEVKWLGKSLDSTSGTIKEYSQVRALEGAKQLAGYLEMINQAASDKITKGYLVLFDARRKGTKNTTTTINMADGLDFESKEIQFSPEYHKVRVHDFAIPSRFFMKPKYTP